MRVLVTGSRAWEAEDVIRAALDILLKECEAIGDEMVLVHGACLKGADAIANEWAGDNASVRVERHPARWREEGRAAGFRRNARMVAAGADVCLAFIRDGSRGATHCAALAEREGITVRRFEA